MGIVTRTGGTIGFFGKSGLEARGWEETGQHFAWMYRLNGEIGVEQLLELVGKTGVLVGWRTEEWAWGSSGSLRP
jgi:hypothetical protein